MTLDWSIYLCATVSDLCPTVVMLQAEDTKKGKIELAPNPNSTPESFLTFNGSKEPKWNSAHDNVDAFFVFSFFWKFWPTEIWRVFCKCEKNWGNTELENASASHCRPHHTEARHIFRFVRRTTIMLGSCSRMWCLPTAYNRSFECQNREAEILRCFFPKKKGL